MRKISLALAIAFASMTVFAPLFAPAQGNTTQFDLPPTTPEHFGPPQPKAQPSAVLAVPALPAFQETPTPTLAPVQPQASTSPQASASPEGAAPAPAASVDINSLLKHSNPNFNPCGGWRQLLVSYAAATNCVIDAGEVILGVNYAATYIPANTQLIIGGTPVTTSTSANTHAFPSTPLGVGIPGRWQFSYTPPEYQEIIGYNHNVDKSGATNQIFSLRNMFFWNRCFPYCGGNSLSAIQFTYEPPSGSPAWRGIGPRYTVSFSTTVNLQSSPQGLNRLLFNIYDPVTYSVISAEPGNVQWGVSSTVLGTLIWIHHSWRMNFSVGYLIPTHEWVWNLNPNYLISRRLVIGLNYGGTGYLLNSGSAILYPTYLSLTNTTRPRFLDFSIYYLLGHTIPPIKGLPEPPPGD